MTELLNELLQGVEIGIQQNTETMVRSILSGILRCTSITDIIEEIIQNLPIELSEEQRDSVHSAAEKLYQIQEPPVCILQNKLFSHEHFSNIKKTISYNYFLDK